LSNGIGATGQASVEQVTRNVFFSRRKSRAIKFPLIQRFIRKAPREPSETPLDKAFAASAGPLLMLAVKELRNCGELVSRSSTRQFLNDESGAYAFPGDILAQANARPSRRVVNFS
jgi:hypothetical protein